MSCNVFSFALVHNHTGSALMPHYVAAGLVSCLFDDYVCLGYYYYYKIYRAHKFKQAQVRGTGVARCVLYCCCFLFIFFCRFLLLCANKHVHYKKQIQKVSLAILLKLICTTGGWRAPGS